MNKDTVFTLFTGVEKMSGKFKLKWLKEPISALFILCMLFEIQVDTTLFRGIFIDPAVSLPNTLA